jgi:parvulin-like peptidyl-prolyl isomerase
LGRVLLSQPLHPSIIMKITANRLDPNLEHPNVSPSASLHQQIESPELSELESPLSRLCQNTMSGAEFISLLQQYWMLPQLQRELILDERLAAVVCSQEEVFSAYQAFYRKYQIDSDDDRAAWLERNRCTLAQLEHSVLRTLKLDRFKSETFGSKVDAYFLQRKAQLDRAMYSLLRVKDTHLAQELFFRIQAGEATFTELVPQYSGGQETEVGGVVGPHELSIPHPILAAKIRSLQPGQLAAPLQVADWFVIVRVEKHLPAKLDEAMRLRLIDELYEQWIQEKLKQLIN